MKPAGERVIKIIKVLKAKYPKARTALRHRSAFELLVSTILSAQCTDKRVNMITPRLFAKYRSPGAFARVKQSELEKEVRSTGFYRNKARNIIAAAKKITEEFNKLFDIKS